MSLGTSRLIFAEIIVALMIFFTQINSVTVGGFNCTDLQNTFSFLSSKLRVYMNLSLTANALEDYMETNKCTASNSV